MKDLNSLYRPKKWNEVKGQDKIVNILKKQVLEKKGLSNAYIFSGPSGIGKTTLTRLFFTALNCESLDKEGNPCYKCDSCSNISFSMNEINASDTRGIDDMRELIKSMQYKNQYGKYKSILLDEVHMLTKPAFNCLLKPIEETASDNLWFLCTTEYFSLPKTIQTRCQVFKLNSLSYTFIFNRLSEIIKSENIKIETENIWQIARNSDNNLRQAVHLLEQYISIGDIDKVLSAQLDANFLDALKSNNSQLLWQVLSNWSDSFNDINAFLNSLKYDISNCIKLKLGIKLFNVSAYREKKYSEFIDVLDKNRLIDIFDMILEIQEKVSGVWDYNSLFLKALCKLNKKS